MRLTLDGTPHDFTPIKDFRAAHGLPPSFGVNLFEPKDYAGLGSIERAGAALNAVRAAVLDALPEHAAPAQWAQRLPDLVRVFEAQVRAINPQVGLKDAEIAFAVSGFADVLQAWLFALQAADARRTAHPPFMAVYGGWLNDSARRSAPAHDYGAPDGTTWRVRTVTHAYGRCGLVVEAPDAVHYVADSALACPAEGFMAALLAEVAARMGA